MNKVKSENLVKLFALVALVLTSFSIGFLINIVNLDTKDISVSDSYKTGYYSNLSNIYKNDQIISLKGVVWTGFETEAHVVHGLWARNWRDIIQQTKSDIGANAIKIPICTEVLENPEVASVDYKLNPDLQDLKSLEILDLFVKEFEEENIHFVITLDRNDPNCATSNDLWYSDTYTQKEFEDDLVSLATRYKANSYFVGIELTGSLGKSVTWGEGNSATDWNTAIEKVTPEILNINPNIIVIAPGLQSRPNCAVNSEILNLSFIGQLKCTQLNLDPKFENKVLFASSIDIKKANSNINNIEKELDSQFSYFYKKNSVFLPTKWNGVDQDNSSNFEYEEYLSNYFVEKNICSSFYFSLNSSAGEDLGILNSDWNSFNGNRVKILKDYWANCKAKPADISVSDEKQEFCKVEYTVSKEWANSFIAEVKLTNLSNSTIENWELNWQFKNNQKIINAYNSDIAQNGSAVSVINLETNKTIPGGNYITFGFVGSFEEENPLITEGFRLNGIECK